MNPILKLGFLPLILFPFGVNMAARYKVPRRDDHWEGSGFWVQWYGEYITVKLLDRKLNVFYPVYHSSTPDFRPGFWQLRLWWEL